MKRHAPARRRGLRSALVAALLCSSGIIHAQALPPLIPMPAEVKPAAGQLAIDAHTPIAFAPGDKGAEAAAHYLAAELKRSRGLDLALVATATPVSGAIMLRTDPKASVDKPDGYTLDIDASGVRISSRGDAGLFYGAVTLWQLATTDGTQGPTQVPDVAIRDWPRFAWRGLMLDVVRHFRTVAEVKEVLDTMAEHKLNTFHWHLSDDQGWRIEIKRYPKLTSIGGWRTPPGAGTHGEPLKYGGFYTQAQIRDVVAYAAARHITVVPELDMPGHAQAAVAAYPEIVGVTGERPAVSVDWGVNPYLYNVDDKSFTFIQNVLDEVMALFPSTYIHIGGDEAVKDQWKNSPAVQAKMTSLGIKDENALQSWFTDRLGDYLGKHGRRLIGWDEILEGGLPRTASVMSWRGVEGAIDAAKQDHDVVLAPAGWMYFDNHQSNRADEPNGRLSVLELKRVYGFEPVDASLTPEQAKHVLGTEATLWAEFIPSQRHVQHALFPRVDAMSEIAWSPREARNWDSFQQRLPAQFRRYAALDIVPSDTAFAPAIHVNEEVPAVLRDGKATVSLDNQTGFGTLRYTTDGSTPGASATVYSAPFPVTLPVTVRAATFAPDGMQIAAARSRLIDRDALLTRRNGEFTKCPDGGLGLRMPLLPDLGAMDTPVYDVDLFHSCWLYPKAPLDGITGVRVEAARLARNYGLAHDQSKVVSYPAKTKNGELEVHQDTCAGPLLASLPLPDGKALGEKIFLQGKLPATGGEHDLCLRITAPITGPLYGLQSVQLMGGQR
ncbi:beta-N-acetylhexosaminidase [Luteibacter sp. 621]|uniref:beta-N-acetylhexosaminidase n=1 Tax=Luteibacter sp. 621 TaxID=3373916 RepID=UPI003D1E1A9D